MLHLDKSSQIKFANVWKELFLSLLNLLSFNKRWVVFTDMSSGTAVKPPLEQFVRNCSVDGVQKHVHPAIQKDVRTFADVTNS